MECRHKASERFRELCTKDLIDTSPWVLAGQAFRESESFAVPLSAGKPTGTLTDKKYSCIYQSHICQIHDRRCRTKSACDQKTVAEMCLKSAVSSGMISCKDNDDFVIDSMILPERDNNGPQGPETKSPDNCDSSLKLVYADCC